MKLSNNGVLSIVGSANAELPTEYGDFMAYGYADSLGSEHFVLVKGDIQRSTPLCRVHSECITGNVFASLKCDCAEQLAQSLKKIEEAGVGVFIYLRQEGRGIGLVEKIKAYSLQSKGYDTYDANVALGHDPDPRDYYIAYLILHDLGISAVRLISNNPQKISQLEQYGIRVEERESIITSTPNPFNRDYLRVKAQKFQHYIDTRKLT